MVKIKFIYYLMNVNYIFINITHYLIAEYN